MNRMEKQTREARLSPERRALLEHMYTERLKERKADTIIHQTGEGPYPLSFAQERLWFIEQLEPQNELYNEHAALQITGSLDRTRLEHCFRKVIQRHEILRTVFVVTREHGVQQQVLPEFDFKLLFTDLLLLDRAMQDRLLRQMDKEWRSLPFDLLNGPLLRVKLIQVHATRHIMLITFHHSISDGWSIGLFAQELLTLYTRQDQNHEPVLPDLPIQYRDFAGWQRQSYTQNQLSRQLAYWKKQLAGTLPVTEWPVDQPSYDAAATPDYQGEIQTHVLPPALMQRIRTHCIDFGITPFIFFSSILALLVSRHTRQDDLLLGTPIAGRTRKETERLIGCFLNTLPLRLDLSDDPTFEELLQQARTITFAAHENQDVPFEQVVQALQPDRQINRNPLFTIFLNVNNTPQVTLKMADLHIEFVELSPPVAKFPLTMYVQEQSNSTQFRLVYQTALYSSTTMRLFLDQYTVLLEQVLADPQKPLSAYSLLTPATKSLLPDLQAPVPRPEYPPLPSLMLEQASLHAERIALVQGSQVWHYETLVQRSTALAHVLLAANIQKGEVVAVCGTRGTGTVAAMLAVLLSGGVLLTIDTNLPLQRQSLLLQEAKVRKAFLIKETEDSQEDISVFEASEIYCVSQSCGELIGHDSSVLLQTGQAGLPEIRPEDPAYLFFTSGTTGKPKGVLGTHRGLSHFLHWQRQTFQVCADDRCAQLTGLSFDVVLRDIFLPLVSGASLVIPAEPDKMSARSLMHWMAHEKITLAHTTPSLARTWLDIPEDQYPALALRLLFFAGETLTRSLLLNLRKLLPAQVEVINLYGPTETSLAKCYRRIALEAAHLEPPRIPIGQPLPETQVALLSPQNRQLCGIGEIGELVIRTPFRSMGYMNAPQEQQERFVLNPWGNNTEDLLYLTGDYGRYLADGTLDILGRVDTQLKIRGVRIEPGEVATQLARHPALNACAVQGQLMEGETHLVAYAVPSQRGLITVQELRRFLASTLPAALMPSAILLIDELPLTTNGKIDYRALPPLTPELFTSDQPFEEPQTPSEKRCAAIWQEVLHIPVVGRNDHFFALGGHSLLAMEIVARLEEQFQVHIPLKTLFTALTVRELALACDQMLQQGSTRLPALPVLVPQPEHLYAPFPLTDIQQAYWVGRNTSFEMGNIATHNYSEFIFSDLDLKRFQHALQRLIQRHAMLRAVIRSDGTQQFLSEVPPYIVQFYDLRQAREEEIEQHLQQIRSHLSHQVFPLDQWPFFEVQVSQVASTRFLVHISIDALICDAWSRQIIGQELLLLYTDADLQLPPLTLSFRDYVIAERALQETERYHRAKSYWMERLNDLPPAPELPLLVNPRQIQTPHFVRLSGGLSAESWRNLQKRALALQITPSALISAAYLEILTCWSKTKRLTINLTLFHRMPLHPQVNQIVGDFTSLLLLSSEGGAPTFAERAKAIHAQMLEALDQSLFSGIEVLRELNRRRGAETGAIMPVVLTSTLGSSPGHSAQALDTWYEGNEYGISQTPQVYIDHAVSEQRGELVFRWDAVQEIFPEHMIADMFAAYQQLLQALADDEEYWSLSTRTHLLPAKHQAVQKAANATQEPFVPGLLHQGFLQQACAHPEALAIFTAERQITYRELDLYSANLAHTLYTQGARPDQLIAVCMEKGWEQIVAVLAILRAGAAYVPIDPALPPARRQQLFEQAEVTCILTQPWLDKALEWPDHCQRLIVEDNDPPNALPDPWSMETTPAHLAYVIYTSGSTGMPKGVMIDHQSALNTIEDMNQRFVVGSADRVLALSALNFDLSVYDVFGLLAAGGCLVMPAARAERDPAQWIDLINKAGVTIWNTVPALLEMLVEYIRTHQAGTHLTALRLILLSGDWIGLTLPDRIRQLAPQARLISLGGATEASIWSIFFPIEEVDSAWQSIPYGKPLRNQFWQILDDNLEPCPIWVPGQLYIGGIGLARGYWRDPNKSAASFFTHPRTGERLYRTGDTGRYLPDGQIEFLGREDMQVKIQGHRIELGEIEATLENHPQVRTAIVLAQGEPRGARSLVGYILPHSPSDSASLRPQALRDHLRLYLPDYMVPKTLTFIDEIPLTSNGKVDRKALVQRAGEGLLADNETNVRLLAPRTTREEQLVRAFALTLGLPLDTIALDDNFFMLGGNSISAIQLIARCNDLFKTRLPLRTLFEAPTVEMLAATTELQHTDDKQYPQLTHVDRSQPLPLSLGQERIWFLCQLESNSSFYHIPAAVRLRGPLDQQALAKAVLEIQQRHETLRTIFPVTRGQATQVILTENLPSPLKILEYGSLPEALQGKDVDSIIAHEVDTPFHLESEPLFRVTLLAVRDDEHIFIVTMHHIIADAWSIEVFIRELIALYEAFALHLPARLSPLTYQYVDFAQWQRALVRDPSVIAQIDYWRNILSPIKQGTMLRTDIALAAARTFHGERKQVSFTVEQTRAIRELAQREQITSFLLLLGAYVLVVDQNRVESQEPIAINTSIANRSLLATEDMIGFFLSTLIVIANISPDMTVVELFAQLREHMLETYNNQDIPFEQIVKATRNAKSLNFTPFSRVAFGMRNTPLKIYQVQGLTIEPLVVQRSMAKFDLELQLLEDEHQITGFLEYNAELFHPRTINRLLEQFMEITSALINTSRSSLETVLSAVKAKMEEKQSMKKLEQDNAFRKKLLGVKPKAINVSRQDLLRFEQLKPDQALPVVVRPALADLDLVQCVKENQELLKQFLTRQGGLLFRGFSVPTMDVFQNLVRHIAPELLEYKERSTPRTQVGASIYTSTEYAADQHIALHNENSYSHIWPMKIAFYSRVVATKGGETPIVDSRKVYQALPEDLRERFARQGVMYVRNYGKHLDLSWQTAFQTSDRAQVEEYCRKAQIEWEWLGLDRLRTRQIRQGVLPHPITGEMLWFNQAHLFHVSSLGPEVSASLLSIMEEQDLPRHASYGDGSPIELETLETIREAYREATIVFPWQQDDVLLLDNMLTAHGRTPYEGSRQVLVIMAEPFTTPFTTQSNQDHI